MDIQLDLPFEHHIIGFIDALGRTFVTVARAQPYHPFVSYVVGTPARGSKKRACYNGVYYKTRSEAFTCMMNRTKRWLS